MNSAFAPFRRRRGDEMTELVATPLARSRCSPTDSSSTFPSRFPCCPCSLFSGSIPNSFSSAIVSRVFPFNFFFAGRDSTHCSVVFLLKETHSCPFLLPPRFRHSFTRPKFDPFFQAGRANEVLRGEGLVCPNRWSPGRVFLLYVTILF